LSSALRLRPTLIAGIAVFLFSSLLVFFLTADLFQPNIDEGIYLEGGHRILHGEVPYRDFFAYTGPLVYWIQAALETVFGPDMRMLRLSVVLPVGLTCFGMFWMAERFAGWQSGIGAALVFLGMRIPSYQLFTVNHRWLSTCFLTLAIAAALDAATLDPAGNARARWLWCAAGALAAAAAWSTPPYLIPLAILVLWTASRRGARTTLAFLTGGVLVISLPALLWLAAHHALAPMLDKLVWASRRYEVANRVPFGYYPYGFQTTRQAVGSLGKTLAWIKDVRMMIPVVLVPLSIVLGMIQMIRGRWKGPAALLVWLALGMLLTTWPRWDVNLLIGVTPPCYAILLIWCEETMRSGGAVVRAAILSAYLVALTLSFAYAAQLLSTVDAFVYFPTRFGLQRNIEEDGEAWAALEQRIPEGESVFVFPYLPVINYMLKTRNPTSYSWLQPGMMSHEDEAIALHELQAGPPKFILRQYYPDARILNVWPNSDRSRMRFPSIEEFIASRYTAVDKVTSPHFEMTVFERQAR
jgi:4-amino-4-deoxy-L-arabinose transferase-like glycosyltransferase